MTMKTQECSTAGCVKPAAFTTRTKPAWCIDCLDKMLREAGLEPAEPFPGPKAWWLTTCLTCGVQADYRLEYILTIYPLGEITCRVCRWRARRRVAAATHARNIATTADLRAHGCVIDEDLDYPEHIQPIHYRPVGDDGSDLWVVGCTACEAIMTARMDDAVWECACGVRTDPEPFRPRPAKPSRRIEYPAGRVLLRESQSPALPWWDHERNDKSVFETVSVRAFLTCHWVCPECELRFSEQVRTMTAYPPQCPDCRTKGGRSQVELDHYAAAVEVFGNARSGEPLEGTWASWRPDITVDVDGRTLVIEYDGAYWHTGAVRAAVDKRKSLDLLAAGCVVVRLRENDLPSLPIDNPRYREIQVHSTVPRPRTVMEEVRDWVAGLPRRQP